jgi:hypothetical protein
VSGNPSKVGGARDFPGDGSSRYDLEVRAARTSRGSCSRSNSASRVMLLKEGEDRVGVEGVGEDMGVEIVGVMV